MTPMTFLLILLAGLWLWTIVDCIAHEEPRAVRITWLVALLMIPPVGPISALAYYFFRLLPRAINRIAAESEA